MKIAIATENGNVAKHFGYCESFTIFDILANKIQKVEVLKNPGHKPGFLPKYLKEQGINLIISGGMGASAVKLFEMAQIEVIVGAESSVNEAINEYLKGRLISSDSVCHEHQHKDECHD